MDKGPVRALPRLLRLEKGDLGLLRRGRCPRVHRNLGQLAKEVADGGPRQRAQDQSVSDLANFAERRAVAPEDYVSQRHHLFAGCLFDRRPRRRDRSWPETGSQ